MSRYAKPDSGKTLLRIEKYVESTPVVVATCVETVLAIAIGLPLAINISIFFALFFLPGVVMAVLGLGVYLPRTVNLRAHTKYTAHYFEAKYKIMPKLRGSMEYDIAMPMVRKIYDHSLDGHPGQRLNYLGDKCGVCVKRLKVLRELVPNKTNDESDTEYAQMWLEEKKKLMGKVQISA